LNISFQPENNFQIKGILLGVKEDVHVEYLIPTREEFPDKQVQGTSNCTLTLSLQQWVNLQQSAKEILFGIKGAMKVEYLIPSREPLPDKNIQGTSKSTLPLSPQ
jgi:hypothetical protein